MIFRELKQPFFVIFDRIKLNINFKLKMKKSLLALTALSGILIFSNQLTQSQSAEKCTDCKCSMMECCNDITCGSTAGGNIQTDEIKTGEPKKDEVTGEVIPEGKEVEFSYLGKSYYFANEDNLAKFKSEPIDYAHDINCVVMGDDAASRDKFVEYKGTKYYTCCDMCLKKLKKNPDKYINPKKD